MRDKKPKGAKKKRKKHEFVWKSPNCTIYANNKTGASYSEVVG